MSSTVDPIAVVRAYAEAFNRGDLTALRPLFTDDAQIHGVTGWGSFDQVAPVWTMLHDSLSMRLEIEDVIASGDAVVARFTERGTSVAPFRGNPPTGKSSEVIAIEWFTFKDGRIHRRWGVRDSAAHFRQMGLPL